jgi:hypothetical protein
MKGVWFLKNVICLFHTEMSIQMATLWANGANHCYIYRNLLYAVIGKYQYSFPWQQNILCLIILKRQNCYILNGFGQLVPLTLHSWLQSTDEAGINLFFWVCDYIVMSSIRPNFIVNNTNAFVWIMEMFIATLYTCVVHIYEVLIVKWRDINTGCVARN